MGRIPGYGSLYMVHSFISAPNFVSVHIKPETLKLIEKKVWKSLEHMGIGEKFLNRTPMACAVKSIIDK